MTSKQMLRRIAGYFMITIAVVAAIIVFPSRVHDRCWNAAPFIFSLSFLLVFGFAFATEKK
jgi:hypothetical protein